MSEWIKVSDRLPDESGRFLIYIKQGKHAHNLAAYNYPNERVCCEPQIAYYIKDFTEWKWDSFVKTTISPTHWQPLPKPPKEE